MSEPEDGISAKFELLRAELVSIGMELDLLRVLEQAVRDGLGVRPLAWKPGAMGAVCAALRDLDAFRLGPDPVLEAPMGR